MFSVPTYLKRSSIHGVGVFTPERIREGTVIWDFVEGVDWRITPEELSSFPEPFQSRMRRYCYLETSGLYVLCGDNAKFMNHAADPNCDDRGDVTRAAREIEAGEELTCDYGAFDADFDGTETEDAAVAVGSR